MKKTQKKKKIKTKKKKTKSETVRHMCIPPKALRVIV